MSARTKFGGRRNKIGGTPLHTAADTNQTASVRALLGYCKSNVEILMNGDTTPLYLASQRGFSEVIETLVVDGGANIDFIMPTGRFKGELQAYGANRAKHAYQQKNTEIGNGATALHAAVENGHLLATRTLLRLGAKQLPSMRGASPLLIALQYKHPRIAMALLSKNREAQVNVATKHDGCSRHSSLADTDTTKLFRGCLTGGQCEPNVERLTIRTHAATNARVKKFLTST